MFAVIRTGGKQCRVRMNDVIRVERLAGEPGETIELDQVLMLDVGKGVTIGSPLVEGARVAAIVLDQARSDKILVFKKKRRKNYRRLHGHRQNLTVLRITGIGEGAGKERVDEPPAEDAPGKAPETADAAAGTREAS